MWRSTAGGILCAGFTFFLFELVGCRCGDKPQEQVGKPPEREYDSTVAKLPEADRVDVTELIPADVDLALLSDHPAKVHRWLKGRDWWRELTRSPVWADLFLSGALYELSTARHKLASSSPVDLQRPDLEELLVTPVGLAAKRAGDDWQLLAVKQIDLKVQASERLAEVFNQVQASPRISTQQVEGVRVRGIRVSDEQTMFYAVYSNLLLVSNQLSMLGESIRLVSGKSAGSLARDASIRPLLAGRERAELVAYLRLRRILGWLGELVPLQTVALHLRLGERPHAALRGVAAGDGQAPAGGARSAVALVPLDSSLVIGQARLNLGTLWNAVSAALPKSSGADEALPGAEEKLLAKLTGEAFVVLTGPRDQDGVALPDLALLLHLRGTEGVAEVMGGTLSLLLGAKVEPAKATAGGDGAYQVARGGRIEPAFALRDEWLVIGSSAQVVEGMLAAAQGRSPSLKDLPGLTDQLLGADRPLLGLTYVDCEKLFEQVKQSVRNLVGLSERFDQNDVDETLSPLFDALKKIGKLGTAMGYEQGQVTGNVVPL